MFSGSSSSLLVLAFPTVLLSICQAALAFPRVVPPPGSVIVRANTTTAGEYSSLEDAVNSLPNDNTTQSIFVYPGTYTGQVNVTRPGPLSIYGYTVDASDYLNNAVVITNGLGAPEVGGNDDLSGTLRAHQNDLSLYNLDIKNTYGLVGEQSQAIALSEYGSRVGSYGCGFYGYQDTLYASVGTQVYLKSYIEGAVDFIFGRLGQAYFGGNTIAVNGKGCVTASGRQTNNSAIYVFNFNQIVLASDANPGINGSIYLGRPWADYARVIFKNTYITAPLNPDIWSIWNVGDERTDNVIMADYNSFGPGIPANAQRPNWTTTLDAEEALAYNISAAVGSDWATWVDPAYLI
ncbi:carbohydrate esterase family 8 protein [Jaapia argillacea MUCL 33604]|uniref:Pectinesterase n=1 Tax=Jaapia argillacea MUCL 33604 TaxID=933084 RepID=A0A067Q6H1_9AGAM|nr:carbohydrate esterase family 8 protein [Jaapia argillacea MUCL 33604]